MVTIEKSPNNVWQETNPATRSFKHLEGIKNKSATSYAISEKPIGSKKDTRNTPANIWCSDFKLNIPTNALVKKIKIHYRFIKKAACGKNDPVPCDIPLNVNKVNAYPNFPRPQIHITNGSTSVRGTKHQLAKAPEVNGTYGSLTWTGKWQSGDLSNFRVHVRFSANTNNNKGYVIISYIYATVEYVQPSYTIDVKGANSNKVYNKTEYHLKLSCNDKNLTTKGSTSINLSLPLGFTYKRVAGKGNGKITKTSNRALNWKPNLTGNSAAIEIIFDVNVDFGGTKTKDNFTFTAGIPNTTISKTYTTTIYKELPPSSIDGSSDIETFTDSDSDIEIEKPLWAVLNNAFQLLLEFTEDEITKYSDNNEDMPISFRAFDEEGTAATTWYYSNADNETLSQLSNSAWVILDDDKNYTFNNYFKVITTYGKYSLQAYGSIDGDLSAGRTEELIRELTIYIKPEEADLTVPNLTLLKLEDEELNRLAPNIGYTVQSDMTLTTDETYVRDWYKNFRIGIFNNPILANITSYYEYANTDTSFDGYIVIPPKYPINDSTLTIATTTAITLGVNGSNYNLMDSSVNINSIGDYQIPVTFTANGYDNVILTITLKDSNNQTVYTTDYHIQFQADEDIDLKEVTIDDTDYSNLLLTDIFNNAEYWGETLVNVNTVENITTDFTYNNNYPVYIIITADYPEGDIENNTITFNEPCVIETSQFQTRTTNGLYPTPINSLLTESEDTSEITISPSNTSETIVFSELPLEDHFGTNNEMAIRGIEVTGQIQQSDTLVINAKLKSPTGESRERSIIINESEDDITDDKTFIIGGNGDLWGFTTLDFVNLEDWEIELTIANNLEDGDGAINFGEIQLTVYVEEVSQQNIKCYINGEDISYYGVFLTDVKIPEGLETDTSYLSVDGTDINDAYRQNIKEKIIKIEFDIGDGCDLQNSTLSLREFAKLLVNDRDEYNRPIPKTIEFSHYPDVYWEYIMEDAFDSELDINTYIVKAQLIIPAGTSYDKENTTTSANGYVNGLAAINPVIIVKPTDNNITIRESVSGQEFHIGYTGGWNDKILEIDTEDRIAWLKTDEDDIDPVNLNKYVDYNSDWFILKGEFAFEGINCVIRTVDYQERW